MSLGNKNPNYGLFYFKIGILLFWGTWFSIAFLTNVTDFLTVTNIINFSPFRSGNYHLIEKVVSIYNTPHYFVNLFFTLNILTQGLSAILFFIAAFCFWKRKYAFLAINIAFSVSIFLWAAFLIMEEIFIAYSYEAVHIRLIVFEIISLLMLHFLSHESSEYTSN